jgi:hypothetical protein
MKGFTIIFKRARMCQTSYGAFCDFQESLKASNKGKRKAERVIKKSNKKS